MDYDNSPEPPCRSCTEYAALVKKLRAENFALAADQCHDGYAGEHGHHRCREVDQWKHVAKVQDEKAHALLERTRGQDAALAEARGLLGRLATWWDAGVGGAPTSSLMLAIRAWLAAHPRDDRVESE